MAKENSDFKMIPVSEIAPNPQNPRKEATGAKFDELCASINSVGVIEPIIVRPVKDKKTPYEIVAGERRFKASVKLGLPKIPAVIHELSDEVAYEFMIIENLQRTDLTELEEAESFKAWVNRGPRRGDLPVDRLAEKTGIRPAYIRARIAVLALPKPALDAWGKGEICYGHLEQLLRLPGPTEQKKMLEEVRREEMSAVQLKREISGRQVAFALALFDASKAGCAGCRANSRVQASLFDVGDGKAAACLNPSCFKTKQGAWLKEHWLETEIAKKDKTRGFRFDDEEHHLRLHGFSSWSGRPGPKCLECESFVSIVDIAGKRPQHFCSEKTACAGDQRCFDKVIRASAAAERAKTGEERKKAVEAGKGPRVAWHGEYFRDRFNRKAIERLVPEVDDGKAKKLAVLAIAEAEDDAAGAVGRGLGLKTKNKSFMGDNWFELSELVGPVLKAKPAEVERLLRAAVLAVVNKGLTCGSGDRVYDAGNFETGNRDAVARFLGVDLAKEFAVDEEYLQKKTKAELLAFGKKSGIFKDVKVATYLVKKYRPTVENEVAIERLKKSELVDVFLKSGVELKGKVPAEILK